MPPSDAHQSAPNSAPDDYVNRNAFLDCLLGIIGLCERTVTALSNQSEDPAPAPSEAHPTAAAAPDGALLR